MKNHEVSDRIRVNEGMRVSVGGHQLLFQIKNKALKDDDIILS